MRKHILFFILILALSVTVLTSCNKESGDGEIKNTVTLNVYNWGEYISDGFEGSYDTNAEFEKYFNENLASKYGFKVKVNYTTYATNEDMYSKLSSGAGEGVYDVMFSDPEQAYQDSMPYIEKAYERMNGSGQQKETGHVTNQPKGDKSMTQTIQNQAAVQKRD